MRKYNSPVPLWQAIVFSLVVLVLLFAAAFWLMGHAQ